MEIFYARYNLLEIFARFLFLKSGVLDDIVKEFATACIFHDKIELFRCFYNLI